MSCTYAGCSVFVPGFVLIVLWFVGWGMAIFYAVWAIFTADSFTRIASAVMAAALTTILLHSTS